MRGGAGKPEHTIKFRYLAQHDVVLCDVYWRIDSEESVDDWLAAYAKYFNTHHRGRKVDVIFDLTHFTVMPRMATRFGEARAKILSDFTRRTYRINIDQQTKTAMFTSSVLHGAPANEFASFEEALARLLADRASEN